MAEFESGLHLNTYVAPQLLKELKDYKDAFIGALQDAPRESISADGIRYNKLINNVEFLINNTDPFVAKQMEGEKGIIGWDKLDTTASKITDAELRYLAFDKKSAVREKQMQAFKLGLRDYVVHKLAPKKHVAGSMPVMRTTGAVFGGRKRLTFQDLLNFYEEIEALNLDPEGWNFILGSEHRSDLLVDKAGTSNHRDNIQFDNKTGGMSRFYKMKIWESQSTPLYNQAGQLKARKSVKESGDQRGSVFFYTPHTVYHLEKLMILNKPMEEDTTSADPTGEIRLHGYGLCDKILGYGFGALVSDNA